jgi:hypothetical protein
MIAVLLSVITVFGSVGFSQKPQIPVVERHPNICVKLPWQSNRCTSNLVYATSNSPKEIKNEIERLGAIVDATHDFRIASWREYKKCFAGMKVVPAKCILKAPNFKDLESKEISAWKDLYYFAKQYPNYVQPRQLSKVLSWGEAVLKCEPNCQFKYD